LQYRNAFHDFVVSQVKLGCAACQQATADQDQRNNEGSPNESASTGAVLSLVRDIPVTGLAHLFVQICLSRLSLSALLIL
jgi:hypothetical protein